MQVIRRFFIKFSFCVKIDIRLFQIPNGTKVMIQVLKGPIGVPLTLSHFHGQKALHNQRLLIRTLTL